MHTRPLVACRPVDVRAREARAGAPAGFTLVEVLMAVMLLAIGLLAIAGLAATALRTVRSGAGLTTASAVAQSRLDSLTSVPCAQIATASGGAGLVTGTSTTRGVTERWGARMQSNGNMVQVTDTLTVPGRSRVYAFLSVRACR